MFGKESAFGCGPARFAWSWLGEQPLPWMVKDPPFVYARHGPGDWGPGWPFWRERFGPFAWRFGAHRGFGPFGPGGPRHRMFERGGMKYALLRLLQERPKHGYEMIKELEERFGGFYAPSPGSVYPTLQMLEDQGYVTSSIQEGKKIYTITDAGRAFLAEHPEGEFPRGPFGPHVGPPWMGPEISAIGREAWEVARLLRQAVRATHGNPAELARIRAIIERTRRELADLLSGRPEQTTYV
jgi:DNA-binding PadR family transcriptional regulator